jgi:hypothetical protein
MSVSLQIRVFPLAKVCVSEKLFLTREIPCHFNANFDLQYYHSLPAIGCWSVGTEETNQS